MGSFEDLCGTHWVAPSEVHRSMTYEEITSAILGSSAVVQRLGCRFMLELPCVPDPWGDGWRWEKTLGKSRNEMKVLGKQLGVGYRDCYGR